MTRNVITAVRNTITGAQVNTIWSAEVGVKSSLRSTLRPGDDGVRGARGTHPVRPDPESS